VKQKILVCVYIFFLHLKPVFKYSSLSFVRLGLGRTTDKVATNLQNFTQVGLQLKFASRIRLLVAFEIVVTASLFKSWEVYPNKL